MLNTFTYFRYGILIVNFIKQLHDIYLSLGSNLGNKFEQLQTAVTAIFEELGDIDKI